MKIIPKEFKAVAITLLDAKTQTIRRDLDPRDFMDALEPIRSNIDECFQKTVNRQNTARIRRVEVDMENINLWDKQDKKTCSDTESEDELTTSDKKTATNNTYQKHNHKTNQNKKEVNHCKLCGNQLHESKKCPLFTGERSGVASGECRTCRSGLYHFSKYCPRTLKSESKN